MNPDPPGMNDTNQGALKPPRRRKAKLPFVPRMAREAKAIVALAFRNGPIEDVHAGKRCPTCVADPQYSHITNEEMKRIMKNAVDRVYSLLYERESDPERYEASLRLGERYTAKWDEPETGG